MQSAPKVDLTLDMEPVDYVAKAIVALVNSPSSENKSFNVTNPNLFSYNKLYHSLQSFGYPLEVIPYEQWRILLQKIANSSQNESNPLSALESHFTKDWDNSTSNPVYDSSNVSTILKDTNIKPPQIETIMMTYFSYFISTSFIPQPPSTASNNLHINWLKIGEGVSLLTRTNRSNPT